MFIHTVKSGESLFSISKKYDTSISELRRVNGLEKTNIVPGQALLIPLSVYTVQPGDTLASIARKAFVPLGRLRLANPSVNTFSLQPGMKITIPNISNYPVTTLNYYVIRSPYMDRLLISDFAPYSSLISIFEYHFSPNGDIVNDLNDLTAIEASWENRVIPLATITNLVSESFSKEVVHQVLNNPSARANLINNIVYLVSTKGYGGVNIDFERVGAEDRDIFTGFLKELRNRLIQDGYLLTIAIPAKTSEDVPWLKGYDYGGIGSVVDFMFIMAYDWHEAGSEPGPVAPIDEVRKSIEFAVDQVPRKKIILGVPRYGYDWIIPYRKGTVASAISNQNAIERAMQYESPIRYSEEYKTPSFQYVDKQGQSHEVWFEDVRSISEKMMLVRQYGLEGIGTWQLALEFTPGPTLLTNFFTVRKL